MSDYSWIYHASWDLLAEDGKTPYAAFNLNSVSWEASDPTQKLILDDATRSPLLPWVPEKGGNHTAFDGADFAIYKLNTNSPAANEKLPIKLLDIKKRNLGLTPPANGGALSRLLEELELQHVQGKDYSTFISRSLKAAVQNTQSLNDKLQVAHDAPWSSALGGASTQGYPFAHVYELSHWFEPSDIKAAMGADTASELVILPAKIFQRTLEHVEWVAALHGLRAVYTEAGKADIVLLINSFPLPKADDFLLTNPLLGIAQKIHSATFHNWLGTLPHHLGRYLDGVWLTRQIGLSPSERSIINTELKKLHDAVINSEAWFSNLFIDEKISAIAKRDSTKLPAWAEKDPQKSWLEKARTDIDASKQKIFDTAIAPVMRIFRRSTGLGLNRPFSTLDDREEEPDLKKQIFAGSLAEELFAQLASRVAGDSSGSAPPVALQEIFSSLVTPEPKTTWKQGKTDGLDIAIWVRSVFLPALRDVDSDGQGGSHSGHYKQMFDLLAYLDNAPPLIEKVLRDPTIQVPTETEFVDLWLQALESLSRALEDDEVLRRLFCITWDRELYEQDHELASAPIRKLITRLNLKVPPTSQTPKDTPPAIFNGTARQALADAAAAAKIQFTLHYTAALARPALKSVRACMESDTGTFLQQQVLAFEATIPPPITATAKLDAIMKELVAACIGRLPKVSFPTEITHQSDGAAAGRKQMLLAAGMVGYAQHHLWISHLPALKSETLADVLCVGVEPPPADPTLEFWRKLPWLPAVIGLDQFDAPQSVTPALPLPLLTTKSLFDLERHSGVMIVGRRYQGDDPVVTDASWTVLTVGDPVFRTRTKKISPKKIPANKPRLLSADATAEDALLDEVDMDYLDAIGERPVPNGTVSVAPQLPLESLGIVQSIFDYRGFPMGAKRWDESKDTPGSNSHQSLQADAQPWADVGHNVERYQIISVNQTVYRGWTSVPGLLYGTKWKFDFLFVPIHNTGALPLAFREPNNPGLLRARGAFLNLDKEISDHRLIVTNYLRRTAVQGPRLIGISGTSDGRSVLGAYPDYQVPYVPTDVKPLWSDIVDRYKGKESRAPATTILLRNNKQSGREPRESRTSFTIRPPATTLDNWSIWQATRANDEADPIKRGTMIDCIGDVQRLYHELPNRPNPSTDKAKGFESTQLIDDPAVIGVLVRVRVVLDLRDRPTPWTVTSDQAELNEAERFYAFTPKDISTYDLSVDDPDWSDPSLLPHSTMNACRDVLQTHLQDQSFHIAWAPKELLGPSQNSPITFDQIQDDNKIIRNEINVPEGCLIEISILPCVRQTELEQRFGIYKKPGDISQHSGQPNTAAIEVSATRIWVESVPDRWGPSQSSTTGYLPSERSVWNALQLASVGTANRMAELIEQLETSLKPSESDLIAWAFISNVRADIQPWVWRGTPEDDANSLAILLDPKTTGPAPDEDPSILQALIRGETPSFGERDDAASNPARRVINYANTYLLRAIAGKGKEPEIPPTIIHTVGNTQDETSRYYRVKLVVTSRYAGLRAQNSSTGFDHSQEITSCIEWPWKKDSEKAFHRRIQFRGRMRSPMPLPRVKIVIPLLEPLSGDSSSNALRPGFIAITRDTLRSPWHKLIANVEWAKADLSTNESEQLIKEAVEFGIDGITSAKRFDFSFQSLNYLREKSRLEGRAFGLTYEREADSPAFPNAGFYFDPPFASESSITGSDRVHNWFAKVAFHWEIAPGYVMSDTESGLVGEATQAWWVQLLAPFNWLYFGGSKQVETSSLTFDYNSTNASLTFFESGSRLALASPTPPEYDKNTDNPDGSPAALLLFVSWTLVPDFLNSERSKVAHSIYLYKAGVIPRCIFKNPILINGGQGRKPKEPDGGNFMLLFGRRGDVDAAAKATNFEALVNHYLFPLPRPEAKANPIAEDAKLALMRSSAPVFRNKQAE